MNKNLVEAIVVGIVLILGVWGLIASGIIPHESHQDYEFKLQQNADTDDRQVMEIYRAPTKKLIGHLEMKVEPGDDGNYKLHYIVHGTPDMHISEAGPILEQVGKSMPK